MKKMKIKRIIMAAGLISCYFPAYAIGNLQPVEVAGVYVREGRTDLYIVGSHNNPLGCVNNTQIIIDASRYPNSKAMLAAALAAHMSGKKISGWVVGCTDDRAELSAIHVEK